MPVKLTNMAVLPETKELVCRIAKETNEKKCAIFDRAVRDYARKLNAEISGDAVELKDAIKENRTERKELLRQAREGERLAKSAVKEYGKIKKSM